MPPNQARGTCTGRHVLEQLGHVRLLQSCSYGHSAMAFALWQG